MRSPNEVVHCLYNVHCLSEEYSTREMTLAIAN